MTTAAAEQALRRAADLFHEIGSALAVKNLLADVKNAIMAEKLRERLRSPDQLRLRAAEGRELCARTFLVARSASAVLHRGAALFYEIEKVLLADQLAAVIQRMQQAALDEAPPRVVTDPDYPLRSPEQLRSLTAEGFERCVRALADLGVPDVTIHECGESALGERPWSGDDE